MPDPGWPCVVLALADTIRLDSSLRKKVKGKKGTLGTTGGFLKRPSLVHAPGPLIWRLEQLPTCWKKAKDPPKQVRLCRGGRLAAGRTGRGERNVQTGQAGEGFGCEF